MYWKVKYVKEYLIELGINDISDNDNKEQLMDKIEKNHNDQNLQEKFLKRKLVELKNEELKIYDQKIIELVTMVITIFLAEISCLIALRNDNSISDEAKNNLYIVLITLIVILIVSGGIMYFFNTNISASNANKRIAINMYKSVIEEKLNELEKKKKDDVSYSLDELNNSLRTINDGTNYLKGQMDTLVILHKK